MKGHAGWLRSRRQRSPRLRSHVIRRLSWGIADQTVSSLTNFAVSIYVVPRWERAVRCVQPGLCDLRVRPQRVTRPGHRPADGQVQRHRPADVAARRRQLHRDRPGGGPGRRRLRARGGHGAERHGPGAFLALGLTLPGLLLQDSWRYAFFALGRGSQAFLNDTDLGGDAVPALVCGRVRSPRRLLVRSRLGRGRDRGRRRGPFQARVMPNLSGAWEWVSTHRDSGPATWWRDLQQCRGPAAHLRRRPHPGPGRGRLCSGRRYADGPVHVLFLGCRWCHAGGRQGPAALARHLPLFCLLVSVALTAGRLGRRAAGGGAQGLGDWLLGPIWRPTYPLVVPQTLFVMGQAVGIRRRGRPACPRGSPAEPEPGAAVGRPVRPLRGGRRGGRGSRGNGVGRRGGADRLRGVRVVAAAHGHTRLSADFLIIWEADVSSAARRRSR